MAELSVSTETIVKGPVPIVIDLGKRKKKEIKQIKQGIGDIRQDVDEALEYATKALGDQAEDKILVPVVLIVEKKAKKWRGLF